MTGDIKKTRQIATELSHELLTNSEYVKWQEKLAETATDRWYSVVAEVSSSGCASIAFDQLGEGIKPIFVYRCIPSPRFKKTGEIMVLFNIAGWMWHCLITYKPAGFISE